jgi:GTPase SAR1 family protein
MKTNDYDYIFSLVLLNGTASGKTSILNRFVNGEFCGNPNLTIGVDLKIKYIEFEMKKIKLLIWLLKKLIFF